MQADSHPVVIELQGLRFEARNGVSLVESAREAGIVLHTSCRNGTCRACLCKVLSGSVRHLIDWPGLSAEEKREGCILPCVATAETALRISEKYCTIYRVGCLLNGVVAVNDAPWLLSGRGIKIQITKGEKRNESSACRHTFDSFSGLRVLN